MLGLNQGEIVKKSIDLLESNILRKKNTTPLSKNDKKTKIQKLLDESSKKVRNLYPEREEIRRLFEEAPIEEIGPLVTGWKELDELL